MSDPFEAYSDLGAIAERLKASDAGERRVAVMELADSGDAGAVALLAEMLADPDSGVREQTAQALGEFDGQEAAAALARTLADPDMGVAKVAADSLAELKDPAAVDPIPLVAHASATPGRIIADIPVDLPRPRSFDIANDEDFLRLRRQCHEQIREESLKAFDQQNL